MISEMNCDTGVCDYKARWEGVRLQTDGYKAGLSFLCDDHAWLINTISEDAHMFVPIYALAIVEEYDA